MVGQFKALTFDALFEGVKALPWDHYLPLDAAFPVEGRAVRSQLHSEPDVQAITKKAIVEKMSAVYHRTTRLPETGATYPLEVSILKDIATLTLDTTGSSLFKRGYRIAKGEAPLKENFAAALIMLTNWHPDMPFVDPTTGSGTIAIEAALIGHNIAIGKKSRNCDHCSGSCQIYYSNFFHSHKQTLKFLVMLLFTFIVNKSLIKSLFYHYY